MIREHYIQLRNSNSIGDIVYIFYMKLCKEKNVKPLEVGLFFLAFNHWKYAQICADMIISKLDRDYEIIQLVKDNKIIKFL